jgi:methionyl-tRNA formyltransferase
LLPLKPIYGIAPMKDLRIVFMGTPEFAVATLGALLMNEYNVVSVVTATDKPSGRGRKLTHSPVKQFAELNNIPVLQPENLKDPSFIQHLRSLKADLFIVVAFRMLPDAVWKMPAIGTINLHASLLPQYRGAAPINHAIINGETITGVTTFFIDDKIDTGKIILQEEVPIYHFENAGDLHNKLMNNGARLVVKTLSLIEENKIVTVPQDMLISGLELKTAPKIFLKDCLIDWNNSCTSIHNLVRGLSPYPCARSYFIRENESVLFKVYESHPEPEKHSKKNGEIVSDGKSYLKIACTDGFLKILNIQIEGKKKISIEEFLRGFKLVGYMCGTIELA